MKRITSFSVLLLSGMIVMPFAAVSDDKVPVKDAASKAPKAAAIELAVDDDPFAKFVKLGPGVHAIKKNKKGQIRSCIIVGQVRISTALGKEKGLELSREKASLAIVAEFAKWLKEDVSVYQGREEETIILMEGNEEPDQDTLKETGKAIEKSVTKIESISMGLVRGLQLLHKEISEDGKTLTIIKGWKSDMAEATKKVAADSKSDDPAKPATRKDAKGKKVEKAIKGEKVTSDIAKEFLP